MRQHLIVAMTRASGACAAQLLLKKSPWPTMPLCPPFYMFKGKIPHEISMHDLMAAYVDRVLALLGHSMEKTREDIG